MGRMNSLVQTILIIAVLALCVVQVAAMVLHKDMGKAITLMTKLDPKEVVSAVTKKKPRRSVDDAIEEYGAAARKRIRPWFKAAGVAYPPSQITLVGLKEEKLLFVLAPDEDGNLKKVVSYPILAASGEPGPKLMQGDYQVPEGFYKIELFNPNSAYHLSLRVNYPNAEDRAHAASDKRTKLGGDIMIHGNAVSVGCLAIGDEPIEELFTLLHDTGLEKVNVILAPSDLTKKASGVDLKVQPDWLPSLYKRLKKSLAALPPLTE